MPILTLGAVLTLAILIFPGLVTGQTYVEPEGSPPQSVPNRTGGADPALEFLNASAARQQKLGSFLVGAKNGQLAKCTNADRSGCAKLCLNGDSDRWTNDPLACITQWSDLASFASGSYVRLLQSSELSQLDRGFATVRGNPVRFQLISLLAEADSTVTPNAIGVEARSTSVSHYAGQFFGSVLVKPESGSAELCLNSSGCITSWTDISGPPITDALYLQSSQYVTPQPGNVGLNGPLLVGSLIAGQPSIDTLPIYTCGDGICSAQNSEQVSNCPIDCQ